MATEEINGPVVDANWEELGGAVPGIADDFQGEDNLLPVEPIVTLPTPPVEPVVVEPVEPPKPAEPALVAPPAEPIPTQPAPVSPPAQVEPPVQQTAPVQPPVQPTAQTPAPSLDELEKNYLSTIEANYRIPEADVATLLTEPEKILPRYAAQVQHQTAKQIFATLMQVLPQQVIQIVEAHKAETASRDAFFTRWPDLKGQEEQIRTIGALYRRLNPKSSEKDAIEHIGKTVMAMVGKAEPQVVPTATQPAQQVQQTQPIQMTQPIVQPFQPAGGGIAAPARGIVTQQLNPYEELASEFLMDLND